MHFNNIYIIYNELRINYSAVSIRGLQLWSGYQSTTYGHNESNVFFHFSGLELIFCA